MKNLLLIVLLLSVGFSQEIIHTETYERGGLKSITYFKKTQNGIEIIKYEGYHYSGQKKIEYTYKGLDRRGYPIKDGLWTEWYENGQKSEEKTYKDGKLDGLFTGWFEDGQKMWEHTYKDGEPVD